MRVDGVARPKRHVLAAGERVTVEPAPAVAEPEVPEAPFAIAYEDEHLLVVDKPAGVVVHPARGPSGRDARRRRSPAASPAATNPERAGVVHRLDRDTSGLLVLARSEAVHAALQGALRAREITREYLALVEGRPPARRGTIDAPLGRDRRVRTRISTDTDDPRPAITHFETERDARRTTRCCACGSRPAARTRSARTCWRSGPRSPAIPSTGTQGALGLGAPVPARRRGSRSSIR